MGSILQPGFVYWDGLKYVIVSGSSLNQGPPGPPGPPGAPGATGSPGPPGPSGSSSGPAGGDLAGSFPNPTVKSLTGNLGAIDIAPTGNIITWASNTTFPGITQSTTSSGNGTDTTISAQNASGASSTGGSLVLASGTGTSNSGDLTATAGLGSSSPTGGDINLNAGNGSITGGDANLNGGNGSTDGGYVILNAGSGATPGQIHLKIASADQAIITNSQITLVPLGGTGGGFVTVNNSGVLSTSTTNAIVPFVNTLNDLRSLIPPGSFAVSFVQSAATIGDNGGDMFVWESASTAADNNSTIIKVTSITTGRWVRSEQGTLKIEWFAPSTSDLGSAVQAAVNLLPAIYGGTIDCTGLKGNWTWNTKVTNTKPVKIIFDQIKITSTVQSMFQVQSNFYISGTDGYATQINPATNGYVCTFVAPYNPVVSATSSYGQVFFLMERLYVFGGQTAVNTTGFTGAFEGNILVQDCSFNSMTGYALIINSSFYYTRIFRNVFAGNYGSAIVYDNNEAQFGYNIHEASQTGGPNVQLINPNFVDFDNERFLGFSPNVNSDVDIQVNDTYSFVGGWIHFQNCQFRSEREVWLSSQRTRISTSSITTGGNLNGTVNIHVDGCFLYGPNSMLVNTISRSGTVVTAVVVSPYSIGTGLQTGDTIQVISAGGAPTSGFMGTFTVVSVGLPGAMQTVTWNQAGSNVAPFSPGCYINSMSTSAIRLGGPIGRWIVTNNNVIQYGNFIDDSFMAAVINNQGGIIRDCLGRSIYRDNTLQGSVGYQIQPFVKGGRFFSLAEFNEDSAPTGFTSVMYNRESNVGLQNRIADSENQDHWGIVGSVTVTMGQTDPWGTSRAAHVVRGGVTGFCNALGALNEALYGAIDLSTSTPNMIYLKFWAKGTSTTSVFQLLVAALVNGTGEMLMYDSISLSQTWKQYKIPVVLPPGTIGGGAYIALAPGGPDAMVADGYLCAFQASDIDSDYFQTLLGGGPTTTPDPTFGTMYQKPIGFQNGMIYGGGYTSIAVPDPANLFLTEAQMSNAFLNLTGTLTGTREIVFTNAYAAPGRRWTVRNSCTGGAYGLICGTVGPGSFTILPGQTIDIITDGYSIFNINTPTDSSTFPAPQTTTTAPIGAMYTDLSNDNSTYVKQTGTGQPGWNNFITGGYAAQSIDSLSTYTVPNALSNNLILKFTGALSGTCAINFPQNLPARMYVVINATSGGQAITIVGGTGSPITVAAATTNIVACDGNGFSNVFYLVS